MGTLKRIGTVSQGQSQTQKTGGRLRRIDTGEIITYDPDPVRSLPNVEKITGGRQGDSPSLPTASGWSGGRRGEENAAIAEVTKLRELRDEARQEFLNYRAASTAGITLGTETGGEYTGKKYKSEQEAYDAWQKYKKETEDLEKETGLEEYSFGKSVMGAVQKGLGQIAQAGGDTLALVEDIALAPFELLSGNDLGTFSDKGLLNRWAADIREEQEAVQKYYAPNAEKGGKAAQIFEELGAGVVAAVPQAVLALLTGGGSAAAQTTAGLTRTAAQAVSPGVAATARTAVRTMAKDPQYWTSFAQVVGGSYEQAMDDMIELEAQKEMTAALTGTEYEPPENQNAMRAKAALYAIGNGLMNAAVEVGGGIQTLPDELKRGGSAWRAWVDSMVDEGKEEVVQGVIERALQNPMYGMENPLFSTTDERAILNPVTAGQEFLGGAVVGGVLGGAQTGITRGINEAARRAAARQAAEAAPVSAAQPQRTTGGTTITADTSLFDRGILKNFNQARKYLIDFAQRNFPKSVVNAETGKTIGISRNGLDKFLSGNIPYEKYATGFHIPQLIENAHRVSSASNYHEETAGSIPTFEYYDSPIEIDGKQYNAHIRVKNTNVGDRYYGHTVSEVDDIKIEPPTRVPASETLTGQPENTGGSIGAPPAVNASTGRDPAADTQRTTPVEGTRPLNSDSTIAPGAEVVNTQRDAARADLEESGLRAGAREADIQTARRLSEVLGRNIRFYDGAQRQDPSARANGYFDGSTIYVNSRSANPVAQIISHELTHSVEMADAYRDLANLVFDRIQKTGGNLEQLRQEKVDLYARNGKQLQSQEQVDQEIVAEYVERNLLTNEQEILDLTRENPTLGQRILDWIDQLLAKLGSGNARERVFLTNARNTYARALEETGASAQQTSRQTTGTIRQEAPAGIQRQQQTPAPAQQEQGRAEQDQKEERRQRSREKIRQEVRTLREDYAAGRISDEEFDEALDAIMEEEGLEDLSMLGRYSFGDRQYSIDENYERDIDEWDTQGRPDGEVFILGSTGDVLQGLGAMEQDIYLRSEKVNTILQQHPEMTLTEIKRIPEILDDPVLVIKSNGSSRGGQNTRLVITGSLRAQNGRPVMAVLDLRPVEGRLVIDDLQKVNSAYGRSNAANYVQNSEVLYADEKRTIPLLETMGLQSRPIELQRYGSMGSISYRRQNVNIQGVPFDQVVETTEQGSQRYSFGGESARRADLDALDRAKEMDRQGVAMETIFRDTGWYTGADGKWRTAVDTAPAAAYDGGRTTDQRGGLDDGSETERNAGNLLRVQVRGPEAVDAGVRGEGIQENGGIQEEPGQRASVPRWARGRVIDRPSQAAEIAAENAGRYGADAFVVADAAIKARSPGAWALTSGGRIYISDSIPAELADVVGYHEAVHAAKQNENESYLELLNRTDDEVSFGSQKAQDVINLLAGRRFNGADFLSLDDSQVKTVLDELNALVWGYHKANPENARAQFADMFRDYDAYIADLDAAMESGAEPEVQSLSLPTLDDEDIRYSMDEDTREVPSTAAQEEADRLLFQGVDTDTIREMTGLERTEDGGWRFAVDTTPAPAYDGGKTTDQQGGTDNGQDTTLRGIYGDDVRGRETEGTDPGRAGRSGTSDARGSAADEGRGRAAPASWARGRLIDRPSPAAGIAAENAGRYGTDLSVDEEGALLSYKSGDSYKLNATLRDGYVLDQEQYRMVEALDSALEKLPVYPGRVYRRLNFDLEGQDARDAFLKAHQAGADIWYPAYTSTSKAADGYPVEGNLTVTQIIEGANGRDLDGIGNNFESEVVFPRGSTFSIERTETDTQGNPVIYMREVTEDVAGQLYPEKRNGRVQQVPEVSQGEIQLREVPGVDSQAEAGGRLPGLRAEGADGAGVNPDIRYSMDEDAAAEPSDNPLPSPDQDETQGAEQSYFDTLPRRVQTYLNRAENRLISRVGDQLNVPRTARREYLKGIARQLTEEYLQQGRVSQETMDRMFDEAYDQGVVVDREFYDEYKDLRDYLRKANLQISQEDASDIQDFNDFRKSNFERLNISTKSGRTNIDQVYQELSARWPEFFNEQRESAPSDQLVRMAEVAQSFQIVEKSLSDYYGDQAADYRTWAKNDFETAVTDALADLRNARRYVEGRPAEDTSQAPTTMEEVAALWQQLKEARRTYERAAARNLLTDHDEVQVGRLLRGETELQYLDPDTENVRGITEVYQAKQEYERISRLLRQWNQSRKAGLRSQAEQLLQTANEWKDKKSGILYARETMERNIRDIVPDEQLADQIIETYFAPVHRAAADANRLKNRYRDQVRSMNLSRNVAEGNAVSEAHAVQLLGEAEDNIRMIQQSRGRRRVRDGKTLEEWQAVVNDLWAENPNLDQQKIRSAVAEFRTIYDELFQQMNDTRIRNGYEPVNYRQGYFPHFQPGDGDGIMAQFGRALGIGTEVTALPTTINGTTHAFRPGIRWFGNAQERLGFNTAYDAVEGFDRYIEGVADVIYQTDNIQRLRALATEIRYRTGDEGIRKQIDRIRDDPSLDDEDKRNRIEKIVEDGRFALSNFVVDLDEYTNLLANKKSRADRDMEQRLGRGAYNVVRALESRVAANMVAINPASWLTNFIPLTQGGALLDRGYLLRGMWETLQAYKEGDGLVERSTFLTNRRGSDPILSVYEQGAEPTNRTARRIRNAGIAAGRIGDVLSSPMSYIDNFTADSLVRARYRQNLAKGMSDDAALADADAFAASVMADRSKGATPTMFSRTNPVSKLFTQFQLEVNNQLSYVFKDIPRERRNMGVRALAAALLKFALGAWLYDEVYEFFIGRRPALDPIGILNDTVGDLTGWEVPNLVELGVGAATGDAPSWQVEPTGLYEATGNLGTALAEELPFIGGLLGGGRLPIGSAIPDFATLARAATDDEWDPSKRIAEAWDELQKPLTYLATPFGGGQLKRIYEAIDAVRRGGVYSLDAEGEEQLQYPIYNDTWQQALANALMGSVFGTTALGTGRDWVESGFDTLGARQTAAYQGMVDAGVPGEEAYALLQDLQGLSAQEERQTLRESAVSGAGKSVVYYGLMASDKEKALMDALTDMDADMGEVTETLMAMKDAGMATGLAASNGRRSALQEADLTDEQKIQIYREMISDSRDDDIQSFQDAGMTFDQFLEAQMNYAFMEEEYDQYGNPTVEFHRWVDEQNLTDEQKATVKEAFQYYNQIPQSAGYYDKLTAAGLPEEEAYLLNQELDALEPEDGADSVSSLQRQQTVVNSGISQTDQLAALGTMMPESEFGKVQTGTAYGVTPKAYVDLKAALPRYDSDGNGSFNQAEVTAAINSLGGLGGGLSNSQKAALWQLYNKSWSAKNNPFSVSIGQQVRDTLNQEDEATGLPALGRSGDDLPGLSLPTLD